MHPPSHDPSGRQRTLLAILGIAAIVGGGMVAASAITDRPATVKPAQGTAKNHTLAGAKHVRD